MWAAPEWPPQIETSEKPDGHSLEGWSVAITDWLDTIEEPDDLDDALAFFTCDSVADLVEVWSEDLQAQQNGLIRELAPRAGFEPATDRLTADCSTTELPGNATGSTVRLREAAL